MAAPPPKTPSQGPKTTEPIVTGKPPVVPSKPIITTNRPPVITVPPVVPTLTNSIITVGPITTTTTTTKPPPTFTGGSIITVGPSSKATTPSSGVGNNINNRGQGGTNSSGGDGDGMSAAAIGGLVAGLAIILVGSVVGGFMLLKQRRKRMMFVGLGTSAAGSSSRYGGGDGYPDPPDLPRPPRAGFHQEGRPGSGTWSARSGYSGGEPPSSTGRRPYLNNHSDVFDEKGYHAEAAGLGGARMSVMGGGLGGGSGSGYSNNVSGESFTQLHDGRFVANGRRGDGSPGDFNGVPGDVDNYPYDTQEYDARLHNKEMSSSAAFLPSPPSSPDGPYPLEGISPTESTSSSSARFQGTAGPAGQPSSPPLIGVTGPGSMGGGPNPRASGYYEGYNHVPLRSPSRTNMNMNGPPPSPHNPPMSPNGNFVNRSASRVSASIPYAPDGHPLFPPRPTSQYQHVNYQQQHPGHQQQQYYGSPRSPPPQHMGGGGPPGNGYYSPRLGSQYNHHGGGGGPNFPPSPHPYQQQQQQQQYLQQPNQQQIYSGPTSPLTSSSMTAYDHDDKHHSPQKYVSDEAADFDKHQVYEEIYIQSQESSTASAGAPQTLPIDKPTQDVAAPTSEAANPVIEAAEGHDASGPTDLATLSPVIPKAASSPSPPPVPLSTKPSVGHMSLS